jgi:Protein of unknown function (DUF3489)
MKHFTIEANNNITLHDTAGQAEAVAGAERFTSQAELAKLAVQWPDGRAAEVYNSLPGVKVTAFNTPKAAVARIWSTIQHLGESVKQAAAAKQKPHVPLKKGKAGKKATPAKKAPKAANQAGSRRGSKTATLLELLKRPDGATLQNLMKATGWQAHSVRGFLSGTVGKKMGLDLTSTKGENGERTYSLKA